MKKFYVLAALSVASLAFSQNAISFEAAEGFALGDINGQNGWEVTLNNDNQPIANQVISNEKATQGQNSVKIAVDLNEDFGWFPIYGVAKQLDNEFTYNAQKSLTVEFDTFITETDGSTFEFGAWGISGEEFVPLYFYSFNYTGNLEIVNSIDFDYDNANFTWEANKWYTLKTEITPSEIKYYINGDLVHTGSNYSNVSALGFNFLHDNFDGAAYIDNIKINNVDLATYEAQVSKSLKIYPNPAKDVVTIETKEKVETYTIFNMAGQKVLSGTTSGTINIKSLSKGNYILNVKTIDSKSHSSKLIKN